MIKSNQFEQVTTSEIGTDYEPPIQKTESDLDKQAARLILRMEAEMSRGRDGGIPSNSLDTMLAEISRTSTDLMIERKKIVAVKAEVPEEAKQTDKPKETPN